MASESISPASSISKPRKDWSYLPAETTLLGHLGKTLYSWRVKLSIVLVIVLIGIDVLARDLRPCNVLDEGDGRAMGGLGLILLGLAIRSWAAGTLHKMKALTTGGPYRHMRNPLYFGSFLMMVGFSLIIWDLFSVLVLLIPMMAIYRVLISREERILAVLYPDAWPTYAASTPRFIPYLPKLPTLQGWSLDQWRKNREYQAVGGAALFCAFLAAWHYWSW